MGTDFKNGMKGSAFGGQSLITEQYAKLAGRKEYTYECGRGHCTTVPFAEGVEPPHTWVCHCGGEALLQDSKKTITSANTLPTEQPWLTHWGAVMERRSEEELQEILNKRLQMHREGWIPDYE